MALSLTPVHSSPNYYGTTTTQATNPQNGVTPTVAAASTTGNDMIAVVTAYNSGANTFTISPISNTNWVLLGSNPTPTSGAPFIGVWLLPNITGVSLGGNYGTWNISATGGNILATVTYLEWAGLQLSGTTAASFIDNVAAFVQSDTALTTTGTLTIAGSGSAGAPQSSVELAMVFSAAVATAGGETTANTPTGGGTWTAAYTASSTTSGLHVDVFTRLPGATKPATTVTYAASATGNTLCGILLKPNNVSSPQTQTAIARVSKTGVTKTQSAIANIAAAGSPSPTPVQVTPNTYGNTTTQATNPQNGVTPTITNATVTGNDMVAVVTAYNSATNTFTIGPNAAGWVKLGENATPTANCPYVGFWLLPKITSVGSGGNYGTWNISASGGQILATVTYMEWAGLTQYGTVAASFIDNAAAFVQSATALTTTGTLTIAGGGTAGVPVQNNELAVVVSTAVLTAGGATGSANTPAGWNAVETAESTTSGMKADIFTKLAGTTEPATTVTYAASVTGTTLAGLLLRPPAVLTHTQSAVSRVKITGTKTQSAISRVSHAGTTKTQTAIARVGHAETKTQTAVARIKHVGTSTDYNWLAPDQADIETAISGTPGWFDGYNCTLTPDTTHAKTGVQSMKISAVASDFMIATSTQQPASPGQTYYAWFWLYNDGSTATRSFRLDIQWLNSSAGVISTSNGGGSTETATTWVQTTNTATAPAGTVGFQLRAVINTTTAGENAWLDTATVNTTNGAWTLPWGVAAQPATARIQKTGSGIVYGVLNADPSETWITADTAAGYRVAEIEVGWGNWMTSDGVVNGTYKAQIVATVAAYRAAGWKIVMGGGVYYPPAWALALTDGQLEDQSGNLSGTANVIWNTTLRAKYFAFLADLVQSVGVVDAYRIGVTNGEMYYPQPGAGTAGWWAYDTAALASNPLPAVGANPAWVPGVSTYNGSAITSGQVNTWIAWYLGGLVGFHNAWIAEYRALGHQGDIHVVAPGYGSVPTVYNYRVAANLGDPSGYDPNYLLNMGAPWYLTIPALTDTLTGKLVLDISSLADQSGTPQDNVTQSGDAATLLASADPWNSQWSAARWLVWIANQLGWRKVGESVGLGPRSEAHAVIEQATAGGLQAIIWASDATINGSNTSYILNTDIVSGQAGTWPQISRARLTASPAVTQPAIARVGKSLTKTQSAVARISHGETDTQTAKARVSASVTKTQTAIGRLAHSETATQPAKARVAHSETSTQTAIAHVVTTFSNSTTQTAVGRVSHSETKTQTATQRTQKNFTSTQTAISRVAHSETDTQAAKARVAASVTKTQPAKANVAHSETTTQTAVARVQQIGATPAANLLTPNQADACEDGTTTGFAATFNCAIVADTAHALYGTHSLKATSSTASFMIPGTAPTAASPGQTYTAFYSVYNDGTTAPRGCRVDIEFLDATMTLITVANGGTVTASTGSWVQNSNTATAPEGTAYLYLRMTMSTTTTGEVVWIDGIGLNTTGSTTWSVSYAVNAQGAVARLISSPTTTQTAVARMTRSVNTTQVAFARLQITGTKTQTAVARVQHAETKTQSAISRVAHAETLTQPAKTRIQTTGATTQTAIARVGKTLTATQAAKASISSAAQITHSQMAVARLTTTVSTTQTALGRVAHGETKTQGAIARVAIAGTNTQPAKSRTVSQCTTTQTAKANVAHPESTTQTALGRVSHAEQTTQTALARVAHSETLTQPAKSRISVAGFTHTQTAVARIAGSPAATQTATAAIRATNTTTQTATGRIVIAAPKTQPAKARIQATPTAAQTALGRVRTTPTKTQTAVERTQTAGTTTQPARARLAKVFAVTQGALARVSSGETRTQTAVARVAHGETLTQTAVARVTLAGLRTQPAKANVVLNRTATQSAVTRMTEARTAIQGAAAGIALTDTTTQTAVGRVQIVGQIAAQPAIANIGGENTTTQTAIATIGVITTTTQTAIATIAKPSYLQQRTGRRTTLPADGGRRDRYGVPWDH